MYHWYKHNLLHWWFLSRGQSTTKLTHFGLSVPVIVHINKHFTGYPASQLHVKIQGKWNSSSCHTCASDFSFIRSFLKHLSLKKKKKKVLVSHVLRWQLFLEMLPERPQTFSVVVIIIDVSCSTPPAAVPCHASSGELIQNFKKERKMLCILRLWWW